MTDSNKCPKCSEEIIRGVMKIHEKKVVVCSGCDTKWEVVMHGDGALFEEVIETKVVVKKEEKKVSKSSPLSRRGGK